MEEKEIPVLTLDDNNGEGRMSADFCEMYLQEIQSVPACTADEEETLLKAVLDGDQQAAKRLVEGNLKRAAAIAGEYRDRGLPMGDLVSEANMALVILAGGYAGGDFDAQMETEIRNAMEAALEVQAGEERVEEEMAARVNVLKDISAGMAEELGREATVEELAERMKMTTDEIKDIMKLTLDAMSVTGE